MKKVFLAALSISLCLSCIFPISIQAKNVSDEYSLDLETSVSDVGIPAFEDGYTFSNDCYLYKDSLFYSGVEYHDNGDSNPTVSLEIFQAKTNGDNPKKIFMKTVAGEDAKIELVTEKYILVLFGYAYWGDALLIDRTTGQSRSVEAFTRFGFPGDSYKFGQFSTVHVKNFYPLIRSHSDVSPQRAVVFNGKTAKKTKIEEKCWDVRVLGKKFYYVFEKKDGFYLGSCSYKGTEKKEIAKIDAPKNTVLIQFKSIKKDVAVLKAMGSKGNKTIKVKIK